MTKLSVAFWLCLDGVKSPITGCQRNIFFRPKYMGWLNAGTSKDFVLKSGRFYFLPQHIVHDRVHVWSAQAVQHEPCCRHGLVPHILPKTALSRFLPGLKQDIIVCLWNLFNYIYYKLFRWRWPDKQIVHNGHTSRPQVLSSCHIELKCVQYFYWPKTMTGGNLGEIFQKRPTERGTDWITLSTRPGTLQGRYNTAF